MIIDSHKQLYYYENELCRIKYNADYGDHTR